MYTYSTGPWKDQLTAVNGNTITYDAIGNPLTYYNGMSFSWNQGRKLTNVVIDENRSLALEYSQEGLLARKTLTYTNGNKTITEYMYVSGVLQGMRLKELNNGTVISEEYLWFLYDETGDVLGFEYSTDTEYGSYYYIKNVQGDITGIVDSNGTLIGNYTYDAWGKIVSVTDETGNAIQEDEWSIVSLNPLRYRGYCYVVDRGFAYLEGSKIIGPLIWMFIE